MLALPLFAFILALPLAEARADLEASNEPIVMAEEFGRCYAKSVPRHRIDPWGGPRGEGWTEVFLVTDAADIPLHRYDWYGPVLLLCSTGPRDNAIVIRLGPWNRGRMPTEGDLAFAIYHGEKLVHRYSTLDIAGGAPVDARQFEVSVSHYQVLASGPTLALQPERSMSSMPQLLNPQAANSHKMEFARNWVLRVTAVDGRELTFDLLTGQLRKAMGAAPK